MTRESEGLAAVVCDDRPAFHEPILRLLTACGFDVPAVTATFTDVPALVQQHGARVAVVALPLTGMSGLLAVRALREAVPACEVVLLSPAGMLELAAVEAGARGPVPEDDLRVLRRLLLEIADAPLQVRVPGTRAQSDGVRSGNVSTNPSS